MSDFRCPVFRWLLYSIKKIGHALRCQNFFLFQLMMNTTNNFFFVSADDEHDKQLFFCSSWWWTWQTTFFLFQLMMNTTNGVKNMNENWRPFEKIWSIPSTPGKHQDYRGIQGGASPSPLSGPSAFNKVCFWSLFRVLVGFLGVFESLRCLCPGPLIKPKKLSPAN